MKISTKGRYGLEALMVLYLESGQNHVSLKRIAEVCGISEAYILQIFLVLRRAGIVESVRGAQGGYNLARDPSEITVAEILHVLEGPMSPVACILEDTDKTCSRFAGCSTRLLWEKVMEQLNALARSISLKDLIDRYIAMNPHQNSLEDYCI